MKINLLYFGSDYVEGLTQAHTDQLVELQKVGEINLFAASSEVEQEKGLHQRLKNANVDVSIIPSLDVHKNFKDLAKQIEKIIKEKEITHVNVHNNWQLALLSWIKYHKLVPQKFKIIYTIHGYRHNSRWKSIPAIAIIGMGLLLFADRVISMSKFLSNKFWLVGYKTDIVYYMMNGPHFQKTENHISAKPFKLMFPAQFRHGKRQEWLINAVAEYIHKTGDDTIQLILPGAGPTLQEMKDLATSLGIEKNVVFPGKLPISQIYDMFSDEVNIAVVTSNVETYGRSIAEPYALGRCVITTPTGVALDIIQDGITGFTYRNPKQLADILIKLHANPTFVEKIGNNAFNNKHVFQREAVLNSYLIAIKKA